MVTWAGKELLKNTINTATFHNRILEEGVMWKQWEKECGLTMMVSDDDILKKFRKNHQCSKHRRRDKSRERDTHKSEPSLPIAGSSRADVERWDHSGFQELYPDEDIQDKRVSSRSVKEKRSSSKQRKKKKYCKRSCTPDSEIWEEFKRYKRSKKSHQKSKTEYSGKDTSSGYDNHIKEWKKLQEKSKKL